MNIISKIVAKFKRQSQCDVEALLGMEGLSARNEARMAKVRKEMGTAWIMHPSHKKTRLDDYR